MNEFTRVGKGDEYVEVCMDWGFGDIIPILWMFKGCLGDNITNSVNFKEALKEVFDLDE